MTTTTSHTSEPDGPAEGPARAARLIQNESTTEIPVHLLFRDDPDPASVPLKPAVVGRRQGTGEQPRLRRPAALTPRPVPQVDPDLVERSARVLPGAAGVLAGACGAAGCVATSWWAGVLPPVALEALRMPAHAGAGLGPAQWAAYAGAGALALFGFGGLARGRTGRAWVLDLFGRYRGTVRRSGLLWVNPLLLRRRVDVRLRHWRSEPVPATDAHGVALRVVVLVVWRVLDTARATLGVEDHESYLRECVEAALARVPVVMPGGPRGAGEAAAEVLTRLVTAEAAPVGLEVFSVQPLRAEYDPEVAAALHRRRIAALDAQHRASVLTSVVDSVEDTVTRLTMRGLVELDDHERKVLVKDLTVAFCAGRGETGA
ncbi:SPFH domain-containing protein [Streptomyces purpurascens]|uniref:SPFH domain-containing protein n=1 Tax=Streptomyces purpurascens TaxID=1924 RepID=UPI0016788BB6|nr:SPFH domain-containing protein [Streptomyces purpurascens]MCE7044890.1 SPFH domain-containing protein [Streptomyces purpurascens]GHA14366.1 membrane protein [Streptomyces purpurascens]